MELGLLASTLGDLTYILGALIYALPIPLRRLKNWAPKLMGDGVYIVFWSFAYNSVILLANTVESSFNVSWTEYFNFIQEVQGYFISALVGLEGANAISTINLAPVSTISILFLAVATLFTAILIVSIIVYQYWSFLSVLGIVLMAVPFRISRSAGATLLSFSLVFYFGLPPMIDFMKLLGAGSVHAGLGQILSNPWTFLTQTGTAYIIEYYLLVPTTYLSLLAAITADLADTIGGYGGRIPLDVVSII